MNMRRLHILLVLWCIFLLAPAVLIQLGLFGHIDMQTNLTGGVILLWIVGYLAQFFLFMWIMQHVDETRILWWFVASLLPWAIDWTVPVSPLFMLLWSSVAIGQAVWIASVVGRAQSLQQHGIRATGTVLEVLKPWMNVVINNVYIKRKVRLRIERHDGAPAYEGILNGLFMLGEIPSIGDRLSLVVDPTKPQRFEYDKEAKTQNTKQYSNAPARTTFQSDIADELAKLATLHERGALTDAEFAAAKKKLLHP